MVPFVFSLLLAGEKKKAKQVLKDWKPCNTYEKYKMGLEVLTYTGGVGWQEKETKAESQVHSALKMTYYEAFSEARKALNSEEKTGSVGENIILQDNFDMKA
jgi:hypothetical protein